MEGLRPHANRIWIVGHRGACHDRPENTRASFEAALQQHVDGFECDLQLSRDGVAVVFHDRTLAKILASSQAVHELDFAELQQFDAGSWFGSSYGDERLLTIDELLGEYAARTRLLLEVKVREPLPRLLEFGRNLAERVAALPAPHDAYLLCFDGAVLHAAREAGKGLRTIRNLRAPEPGPGGLPADADELFGVCIDHRELLADFTAAAHDRGLLALTYTVNELDDAKHAIAAGIDVLISDRPGALRGELAESGLIEG